MSLFTKSIQAKSKKSDGIRICIMRRPGDFSNFDIWMPVLAPSHQLLNDSHAKKIEWKEYEKRFVKEVLRGEKKFVHLLARLALENDITILCWEEKPQKCHRRLIAKECNNINPKLKINIR